MFYETHFLGFNLYIGFLELFMWLSCWFSNVSMCHPWFFGFPNGFCFSPPTVSGWRKERPSLGWPLALLWEVLHPHGGAGGCRPGNPESRSAVVGNAPQEVGDGFTMGFMGF